MLTLNDGRSELWQWDTGRTLAVDADCSQVHFSNKVFGRSIDVDVVDGTAIIPDILLQTDKDLTAWAFVGTPENGYTKISKVFKVNRRNKPADYVFTPTEQTTLGEILERLDDIESAQDPDAIKNAVEDYLDNNPVHVEETDPTVPAWAKQPTKPQYTAVEVGAMAADAPVVKSVNGNTPDANGNVTVESGGTSAEIPTALPNPHKLTFSGAVSAEYDGSEPVEVVIPEGGGGGIPLPPTAEVGQFFKVSAVENGKVTAVEAVNMASGGEGEASEFELVVDVTTEEVVQTLEFPFTNQNVKEIFVFVKPAASFAPNNAFFSIEGESQIVFRFAHINSLTIGKTGMFVNAKFAGEMVFSTLCLKADYMWNSDKQYASEYERQNEAEDITKIVLDFYADVPVGTVIRVYAR